MQKRTPEFETFVKLGLTPPPQGKLRHKKLGQNTKKLPPPPLEEIVTFFNKCLKVWLQKSVQFEENGSLMLVNLTKIEQKLINTMKKH